MTNGQEDVVYKVTLDDSEILKELKQLVTRFEEVSEKADKSFKKAGGSAGKSGVVIGGVSGIVQELIGGFVELGKQAAQAFAALISNALELQKEAELTRISVTQIFGGNEAAADAFLDRIKELSIQLGVSRNELGQVGKGILPDVGDVSQTLDLLKNVTILGRDAGQGFDSIRVALEEALSGNLSSLQRRLNIPASTIAKAERYAEQFGLAEGLAKALAERVDQTGLSLDATANTLAVTSGRLQGLGQELLSIFGEGFAPEVTEQLQALLESLENNRDDIEAVAQAAGLLVKNIADLVGTELDEFVNNFNFQGLENGIDVITRIVNGFRLLLDVIQTIANTGASDVLIGLAQRDILQAAEGFQKLGETNPAAVFDEITESIEQYTERANENTEAIENRRKTVESNTDAEIEAANAYLQSQKALQELAEAEEKAAEAIENIQEKTKEFSEQLAQELSDTRRRFANQVVEDEIKAAERRLDIARKNEDALADIARKSQQSIADAQRDFSREEQDIARRAARKRSDIDRNVASERVKIEQDFQQELFRIRSQFEQSAQEAERNNDAQAFLAAVRQRDQGIEQAKSNRGQNVEEAKSRAKEQRNALKEELAAELEDARINNQRKLEDLQLRLNRELEEQALKNERAFRDQEIAEQRQAEARQRSFERELEEFAIKETRRVEMLKKSLADEVETVKAAEEAKKEIRVQQAEETVKRVNSAFDKVKKFTGGGRSRSSPAPVSASGDNITFAADGASLRAGQPAIVGEEGPELFIPKTAGDVIPNRESFAPPAPLAPSIINQGGNTNNATFNVGQGVFDDPVQQQSMRNFILGVLSEVA